MDPALEMKNIVKRFDEVIANKHVNLKINSGEVLCILGENGAGKTTLMNILYGLWQPDEGIIYMGNEEVRFRSPKDAIRNKIGMVSQHFSLVSNLNVSDNITIGDIPTRRFSPFLDNRSSINKSKELAKSLNFNIDVNAKVEDLSVGEQQRVEILKVLYQGAKILILDEPTAVLTSQESDELFKIIHSMTEQGNSVIFITHKLREALLCDRVVVLKGGEVVFEKITGKTDIEELTEAMFGKGAISKIDKKSKTIKEKSILQVKNLSVRDFRGLEVLKNISFEIYAGEIFGVAGVAGNGQRELSESIAGLIDILNGEIILNGKDITNYSTKMRRENGMVHIPEERKKNGVMSELPIYLNLILGSEEKPLFSRRSILDYSKIFNFSKEIGKEYEIKMSDISMLPKYLSGGNIQKLVLAREFATDHSFIIAAQPTRGLDVKTTNFVRTRLLEEREEGIAILLISYDLDEIFGISDRIGVMFEGELKIVDLDKYKRRDIEKMMIGADLEV